jgi:hypothetical protein
MPKKNCYFYLSGNSTIQSQHSFNISKRQIGLFGSLYAESLILSTVEHYELYSKTKHGRNVSGNSILNKVLVSH